jgi:hypothetical protein
MEHGIMAELTPEPSATSKQMRQATEILVASVALSAAVASAVGISSSSLIPAKVLTYFAYGAAICSLVVTLTITYAVHNSTPALRQLRLKIAAGMFVLGLAAMAASIVQIEYWVESSGADCGEQLPVLVPDAASLPPAERTMLSDGIPWATIICANPQGVQTALDSTNGTRALTMAAMLVLMSTALSAAIILLIRGLLVGESRGRLTTQRRRTTDGTPDAVAPVPTPGSEEVV